MKSGRRIVSALGLSLLLGMVMASDASACRTYVRPETFLMNSISGPHDAVVIGTVVELVTFDGHGRPSWEARLKRSKVIQGSPMQDEFPISGFGGTGLCFYVRPPEVGEVWVIYLTNDEDANPDFAYPLADMIDRDPRLLRADQIGRDANY